MTKAELLARLKLAENLHECAKDVLKGIDDTIWKVFDEEYPDDHDKDNVSEKDDYSLYAYDVMRTLFNKDNASNAVYNRLMENEKLRGIFPDGDDIVPYPTLNVESKNPRDMSISVHLYKTSDKPSGDKLVLSAYEVDEESMQAGLIYRSKYTYEHDLALAEVRRGEYARSDGKDPDNQDVFVAFYKDIFDENYTDSVTIKRSEISEAEGEQIDEGDLVVYTDEDGKEHLSPVIDICDEDGRARIMVHADFTLVPTDQLKKAENLTSEVIDVLNEIYRLGNAKICSNGRGHIITDKTTNWRKDDISLYLACNRLNKLVTGTDEDIPMNEFSAFFMADPIERYFKKQGFMYLSGDFKKDMSSISATYFKKAKEGFSLPVKNMERLDHDVRGENYVHYTYYLKNPTYERIKAFIKDSLPAAFLEILPDDIKEVM